MKINKRLTLFSFLAIFFIYLLFAGRFKFYFPHTSRDFFTQLSFSFLNGKLDIPYPGYTPNDLSFFGGKYYLYRGPLPALAIMPLVAFAGTDASDILYTAVFGFLNVLFLYLLMRQFVKFQKLKISGIKMLLLILCFAFGSINLYLSVLGTMWFTSQIVSLCAFILSLYFLFRFLNAKKGFGNLAVSTIFLGLSFLGRYTFILSLPLYLYLIWQDKKEKSAKKWFVLILLIPFLMGFALYNFLRFGNIFESGLWYMQVNPRYFTDLANFGYFSLHFFFYNLYYFLMHPVFPDPEGTSIFVTTPLFLLLPVSFLRKNFQIRKNIFLPLTILISGVFVMIPALFFNGTGWYQFGYRYALDIYPLLFLLLLYIINKYSDFAVSLLVILSVAINVYGAFLMMGFAKYAYF